MIFSKKYEKLFDIDEHPEIRYVIIVGGRASGKSTAVAHYQHDESFNGENVILNTRFTMASAKDSIIAEMEKAIVERDSEKLFENKNNTLHNKHSKSKIIFKGLKTGSLQQTAKLKSTTDLNIWVLDEAEELHDENTFDDVDDSIRRIGYKNLIIMVLNSHHVTKEHFIYQVFFKDKGVNWGFNGIKDNVLYIHTTFLDNWKNLNKSAKAKIKVLKDKYVELEKYKKQLENKEISKDQFAKFERKLIRYSDKYRYNYKGELRDKAFGVIFKNWSFGEFDVTLPVVYGLDFGVADPDALIKVAVDHKLKKLYLKELIYENELSTDELKRKITLLVKKNELIVADSSNKRNIIDIRQAGFNIKKSKKGDGSVLSGIKKILDYEIILTQNSKNIATELNNYKWADKIGEVPIDEYNHSLDALRYACEVLLNSKKTRKYSNIA